MFLRGSSFQQFAFNTTWVLLDNLVNNVIKGNLSVSFILYVFSDSVSITYKKVCNIKFLVIVFFSLFYFFSNLETSFLRNK